MNEWFSSYDRQASRGLGVEVKPGPFTYYRPESISEISGLLAEIGENAKLLAGGQSLVPMMSMRLVQTENVIDINRVAEIQGIERQENFLRVGAATTQATVESDSVVGEAVPLLTQALPLVGHFQIRNRGTIGGSIAHADAASELPAVALALDAELHIAGSKKDRSLPAEEFFEGLWTTALEADELLTHIDFPIWEGNSGFALEEIAPRSGDFALAGAAVGLKLAEDSTISQAAISLFGVASTPVRAGVAETALRGESPTPEELSDIAKLALEGIEVRTDIHANAAYRRRVSVALVEKALTKALGEARG